MAKVKHTDKPGTPAGTSSKTSESSALKRPAAPSQNPQKTAAKNNGAAGTRGAGKAKVVIGRTIKTQDKYLPIAKGEKISPKDKRWIAIIDFNEKGELAIVKLTTQEQPNTT